MKIKSSILFFIAIAFIVPTYLVAQKDSSNIILNSTVNSNSNKGLENSNSPKINNNKTKKIPDSIFVINNKKFQYYNNWFTVGGGGQQNLSYERALGFASGLDFNFHLLKQYYQIGTLFTGTRYGSYNCFQFHAAYGKRFEDKDYHFAAFLGLSYSSGFQLEIIDSAKSIKRNFSKPGIYLQAEIVKKITYDVGIGASFFADWNKEQSMIGMRFILYFSGAYIGKNKKNYSDY